MQLNEQQKKRAIHMAAASLLQDAIDNGDLGSIPLEDFVPFEFWTGANPGEMQEVWDFIENGVKVIISDLEEVGGKNDV